MICLAAETPFSGIFASGVEDAAGSAKSTPVQGLGAIASKPAGSTLIHLYSVAAITDTTGSVVERYGYDAYGDSEIVSGAAAGSDVSAVGQPYRFTGRRLDGETGLSYFRARYYSGELGRFVSRDPHMFIAVLPSPYDMYIDGMSAYRAGFVPNHLDPTGEEITLCQYRTMVPKAGYEPTANGCGAEGGQKFPGGGPGYSFVEACNEHDICYGTCGSNKADCDRRFYDDMKASCREARRTIGGFRGMIIYAQCLQQAKWYANAVALVGEDAYQSGQDGACKWQWSCCSDWDKYGCDDAVRCRKVGVDMGGVY